MRGDGGDDHRPGYGYRVRAIGDFEMGRYAYRHGDIVTCTEREARALIRLNLAEEIEEDDSLEVG